MAPSDDLRAELETRKAQRDILAAWFRERPNQVVTAAQLTAVVGPNYRSRISDCSYQLGMAIPNVPRYREYTNKKGQVKRVRLIGGYKFVPSIPDGWPAFDAPSQKPWGLEP